MACRFGDFGAINGINPAGGSHSNDFLRLHSIFTNTPSDGLQDTFRKSMNKEMKSGPKVTKRLGKPG